MARTERESQIEGKRKGSGILIGAAETSKKLAECRRYQQKKLEHTGPTEKKRVASVSKREQLASTPEPPLPKRERNRAVCLEHQIVKRAFSIREVMRAAAEERERDE